MKFEKEVGFVGIGKMGYPMAAQLANSGVSLTVFDMDLDRTNKFVGEYDAKSATSLSELAEAVDVVITMLPDGEIVKQAVLGEGNTDCLLDGLIPGKILIDSSTSSPLQTQFLAKKLQKLKINMLDAPVAGGVVFASDGSLDITVGGAQDIIEFCMPIFDIIGKSVIYCGDIGSGHAMKILNNFINANSLISFIEALTIGKRIGLDLEQMINSMKLATTGRNNPLEKKVISQILSRKFNSGMAMELLSKDIRILSEVADHLGCTAPLISQCNTLWDIAKTEIGNLEDQTNIAKYWEEKNSAKLEL